MSRECLASSPLSDDTNSRKNDGKFPTEDGIVPEREFMLRYCTDLTSDV